MIKIALFGMAAIITAMLFKKGKEEYSFFIGLAACFIILLLGIERITIIIDALEKLQSYISLNKAYVSLLIKIIGITYITEFASSLCKDSGYRAIGEQIELVGKLTILAISMPILLALLDTLDSFLKA